jgi:putative ABC transport system substrate-binding protein
MRRRDFIALLGRSTVAWPIAASAQQSKLKTIGVLVHSAPGWERFWRQFPDALRELGYIDRQNTRFEFRSDEGNLSRLPELAAELVRLKVDVIVTWYTPSTTAAKQATREIPIVCALCGDMIGTGLVESLDRPGGNVTGSTSLAHETSGKLVELIREIVPSAHRVAALANAPDPFSKSFLKGIQVAGEAAGTAVDSIMIHSPEELDAVFPAIEQSRPVAVILQPSLPIKRAAELSLNYRIPAVCTVREFAYDGGLLAYFAVEVDMYRRAAVLVDKILKGTQPADLPVEQPTKFELIINLRTAKALGLDVPATLIARADEVIE